MKTKLILHFSIAALILFPLLAIGQFQQIGGTGIYETQNTVSKIGIGYFGGYSASVLAALHIDGNTLATTTGEVFRQMGRMEHLRTGGC